MADEEVIAQPLRFHLDTIATRSPSQARATSLHVQRSSLDLSSETGTIKSLQPGSQRSCTL